MVTSLTPQDDRTPAAERTVPDRVRVHPLALSGSTESYLQLPRDLKVATLTATADVKVVLSYFDGSTEAPGNVLDESPTLSIPLKAGVPWSVPQELEFNKIWAEITAGTGSATIEIIPGKGRLNGLVTEV
jgi:hypothetical protein